MVSEAAPPPPPRDAFMENNTAAPPSIDLTVVKLGPPLKSNLKRSRSSRTQDGVNTRNKDNSLPASVCPEKKSIQWLDNHGKQLTQVKEFEPSDSEDSDTEYEYGLASCTCAIQ
eukprot:c25056_g3_i1 orf=454-795(-)